MVDQYWHYLNTYRSQENVPQPPLETLLMALVTLNDLLKVYEDGETPIGRKGPKY